MKDLFSALDTPGGHMAISLFLVIFGCGMLAGVGETHPPLQQVAHDIVIGAVGILWMAMKGQNGGRVTVTAPPPKSEETAKP
jgi:hypothetical protein